MTRISVIALAIAVLGGCTAMAPSGPSPAPCPRPSLADWVAFVDRVDRLDAAGLVDEYTITTERLGDLPRDADRLRLSYLLSRPELPMRDVARSETLLAQISSESDYAPYRDLMIRELAMANELRAAQKSAQELRTQLEALKGIDTDLTRGQEEIEELTQ